MLRDEAQESVRTIIEESASGDFAKGTDEQKVGDLYKSYLDWDARNARGMKPLQPELDRIDSISDYDDLAVYFAETVKRGLDAPFGLGQYADFKNPKTYMIYASQSGLGLPDREYYLLDDEKSVKLREQYVAHIEAMFGAGRPAGRRGRGQCRYGAGDATRQRADEEGRHARHGGAVQEDPARRATGADAEI